MCRAFNATYLVLGQYFDIAASLGMEDQYLSFILTRQELVDSHSLWMKELKLGHQVATEEEYKRLVALLVGSGLVSFQNQSYAV